MIIPVRCFTCGKVIESLSSASRVFLDESRVPGLAQFLTWWSLVVFWILGVFCVLLTRSLAALLFQVIGNKWDTYLDLLQADYTEG